MADILRVGVAGLGTVGASVVRLLQRQREALAARTGREIRLVGVSSRDKAKDRGVDLSGAAFFDDPAALAASQSIDLFVELIGGAEGAARKSVETALAHGRSVVTANKALLAAHGAELAALAEEKHAALAFEASVAGGIPIVKTLREGLAGNSIERVYGVLNGTCNYILSRMELERLSFSDCLTEAQRLGYAEADPTFDIGGFDTAHKLAILASLAFGTRIAPEAVDIEGIEHVTLADIDAAAELGFRIKLLGVAQRTAQGIEQRVHPTMVRKTTSIAQVMGVTNAVTIDADAVHELTLVGPGAGGDATASAVVADIADIARGVRSAPFGLPSASLRPCERTPVQRHEGGYYIRLSVPDVPGAFAAIATRMAERKISLESIMQHGARAAGRSAEAPVGVILITHATTELMVREALDAILADGTIAEPAQVIRIERE
ncbi:MULTISPECIES: homoserine dehydrogenase [Methylosinus]|uniref:Homoserine dehydrogenase n=1 Tax=Methylosinus trichosporium (strain ATCC 35070 / NCIMB 11131 / UNIQEM 75 / OB3b) TaxID=595536 RepID=A0A2D2D502_METT3|nr:MULTISPECIES: homoserine dehydrogenase [Methylosinus]ATQ70045.1 homoserine dehydrogenase [Methylosinus trichosporium OB3b]OBS53046.1 homoserine dehydrogenase [Methylosinus sp. 3S-1]